MVCVEVANAAYVLGFWVLHFMYSHPPRSPQEQPKGKQNEPFRAFNRMKKMAPWVGALLAYIIREQKTTIRPAILKSF